MLVGIRYLQVARTVLLSIAFASVQLQSSDLRSDPLPRPNTCARLLCRVIYPAMPYKGHASPWIRSSTENEAYKDCEHEIRKSYWCCCPFPCVTDDVWRYKHSSGDTEKWAISEEEMKARWSANAQLMMKKDKGEGAEKGEELVKQKDEAPDTKAELVKQKDAAPEDTLSSLQV